ncbi:phage SPO1 DNA polymerase-related protein [Rhodopirellula maiorica SM1]|uniref:Type-4 uracil-DNA glycosylase n=1 Tax=Rhodopirellula maiorica SM1 TaxID=1265738 RepID=M5RY49_9BACT|nr:uracil-DNA glycosylase [Rhodopirellula maiorica]EMI20307.1 phage SPO1 DNA polymerase-related protein [Rhodopirellula maiorica SM1]
MSDKILPPLDRDQLIMQAAALADHLARAGVQWMPRPNADAVETLKSRFEAANSAPRVENVGSPVATSGAAAAGATAATSPQQPPAQKTPAQQPPARQSPRRPALNPTLIGDAGKPYPGTSLPIAQRESELAALASEVAACERCPQLVRCRTNTVFGEGNAAARVVFFGEGPGADEDRSGRPFVGKAGQLLTKMIQACKFAREDVYILNTVKCRPPGNRNPEPVEIANCRPYFEKQIELIRPEYIVCLGAVSGQSLLDSKLSVGRLRGQFHSYFDSKVIVTYHPAYLLRNPAAKKAAWEDLQMMLRDAGLI